MKPSIIIRPAVESDANGIGKVHVDSWRTTYARIFSRGLLEGLSYETRSESALNRIRNPELDCFVAEDSSSGQVIGFSHMGKSREPNLSIDGELYAIYLLKEYQGLGIGRKLFETATGALQKRGYKQFFVSVFSDNHESVAFYKKMGGKLIGHDNYHVDGKRLTTDTLAWDLKA
ncbi:MAG: N-acetyltransferase [Bdellovibrionota bacterium]